jgi:hypothetical protein
MEQTTDHVTFWEAFMAFGLIVLPFINLFYVVPLMNYAQEEGWF